MYFVVLHMKYLLLCRYWNETRVFLYNITYTHTTQIINSMSYYGYFILLLFLNPYINHIFYIRWTRQFLKAKQYLFYSNPLGYKSINFNIKITLNEKYFTQKSQRSKQTVTSIHSHLCGFIYAYIICTYIYMYVCGKVKWK